MKDKCPECGSKCYLVDEMDDVWKCSECGDYYSSDMLK